MIHPFKTYPDHDYNATLKMNDNATFTTPPPPPYRRACRAPLRMMKIVTFITVITDDDDDAFCFRISDNDGRRKCSSAGQVSIIASLIRTT